MTSPEGKKLVLKCVRCAADVRDLGSGVWGCSVCGKTGLVREHPTVRAEVARQEAKARARGRGLVGGTLAAMAVAAAQENIGLVR